MISSSAVDWCVPLGENPALQGKFNPRRFVMGSRVKMFPIWDANVPPYLQPRFLSGSSAIVPSQPAMGMISALFTALFCESVG